MMGRSLILVASVLASVCNAQYAGYTAIPSYAVASDTISFSVVDAATCASLCDAQGVKCYGFQVMLGMCYLYTMLRNVVDQTIYVRDTPQISYSQGALTTIEQDILNNVYVSNEVCPYGWTNAGSQCVLAISQGLCGDYASFLGTTWDGTQCVLPLLTKTYSCPNSNLTLQSFTDGYHCYAVIPRDKNVLQTSWAYLNQTGVTAQIANDYCYDYTGAYLASIHSKEENDYIASLKNASVSSNAIAIGLVPADTVYRNASQYVWLDNTPMDYENFYDNPQNAYYLNFALMMPTPNNTWYTHFADDRVLWMTFNSLACKTDAIVSLQK